MAAVVARHPPLRPRGSCASAFSRALAPSCVTRVRLNPACVARPEDADRAGKRRPRHEEGLPVSLPTKRRREGDNGRDDASRASKKQAGEPRVASAVAHVSCTRIRPGVQAPSRPREETEVSARALRHDTHDAIKKHKATERAQQSATRSGPQIPQPAPTALTDPFAAHDALRAALARARPALHMRRDIYLLRAEARRVLDKVVRTVEFNDPFISPQDVLKP